MKDGENDKLDGKDAKDEIIEAKVVDSNKDSK